MVFPKAVYDKVSGNFDSEVLTSDFDIKPEYTRYVALDFTQAASTAGGFDILNQGWQEIPAEYLHNVALDVEDPSVCNHVCADQQPVRSHRRLASLRR